MTSIPVTPATEGVENSIAIKSQRILGLIGFLDPQGTAYNLLYTTAYENLDVFALLLTDVVIATTNAPTLEQKMASIIIPSIETRQATGNDMLEFLKRIVRKGVINQPAEHPSGPSASATESEP